MPDPIDALPTPPSRSDAPATFISRANAFIAALVNFVTQTNAVATAMNLNATSGTSASSNSIGTGAKTFTADTGKSWLPGMFIVIADTAAPSTNSMLAQVTSYDSGTGALVVDVKSTLGSGTKTAWTISQTANPVPLDGSVATASIQDEAVTPAKFSDDAFISIRGACRNLVITNNSGAPNSKLDIDADAIILKNSEGRAFYAGPINLTADITVSGANGLDTGLEANSTWYYSYVAVKGTAIEAGSATSTSANKLVDSTADFTTAAAKVGDIVKNKTDGTSAYVTAVDSATQLSISSDIFTSGEQYELFACAALLSASSSAPTLPSGYDYWASPENGSAIYNDSGGNFIKYYQSGKKFWVGEVTLTTTVPSTSYVSVSLSTAVPPNAKAARISGQWAYTSSLTAVNYYAPSSADDLAQKDNVTTGGSTAATFIGDHTIPLITAQTIYYKRTGSAAASGNLYCNGGEY